MIDVESVVGSASAMSRPGQYRGARVPALQNGLLHNLIPLPKEEET